jgi:hypothetical protein
VSGWTKVFLATALMVVAIVCFNLALWRRMKDARRSAELEAERQKGE